MSSILASVLGALLSASRHLRRSRYRLFQTLYTMQAPCRLAPSRINYCIYKKMLKKPLVLKNFQKKKSITSASEKTRKIIITSLFRSWRPISQQKSLSPFFLLLQIAGFGSRNEITLSLKHAATIIIIPALKN